MSDVLAVRGRPTGRGRPRGPLLHAVPAADRTRSGLCGARVGGTRVPWPAPAVEQEPGSCPECLALLERTAA